MLIDRAGKIAGLNFYPVDERGIAELHAAIRGAIRGTAESGKNGDIDNAKPTGRSNGR